MRLLVLSLVQLLCVGAVYFNVQEGTKSKCLLEDTPSDTLMVGRYKNLDHGMLNKGARESLVIVVIDPSGREVTRQDMEDEGKFAFTSQSGGEHSICFKTQTETRGRDVRTFRVEMDLDVGEAAVDYGDIAKQEHLSAIEVEIRKLNEKFRDLRKEQEYQKKREEAFRNVSESTNSKVVWWTVLQTLALIGAGVWQYMRFKTFFKGKKVA
jgi:hypothetical protein